MRKLFLSLSVILLLAAGCHRPSTTSTNSGQTPQQVQKYTGKLDKVKQIVDENGQQIAGTYTVADGQDALAMLRSFRTVVVKGSGIASIDGITPGSGQVWAMYANGKNVGAEPGSYKVKDGDVLEWKLVTTGGN